MNLKAPEPIILAVALLLLAGTAGYLAYDFPPLSVIVGFNSMEPTGKPSRPLDSGGLAASQASWTQPILWNPPSSGRELFDSVEYMFFPSAYPSGKYIQLKDKNIQSPSGVFLSWYEANGLNFSNPNVDHEDPDSDGFSNITEYKNEAVGERVKAVDCDGSKSTNPHDPNSHPDYLARLRLQKYESVSFHIQFKGYQQLNGAYYFQIYLKDAPSDKQPPLKKTSDQLGVENYVVGEFKLDVHKVLDKGTNTMMDKDLSTLEIDRPDIGVKIIVPFRGEIDSPESTADLVMLMPADRDKVIKISQAKVLTLPEMPSRKFLMLEANDNGARIRDMQSNTEYHILKLDPAEWDEVPAAPAAAAPKQ